MNNSPLPISLHNMRAMIASAIIVACAMVLSAPLVEAKPNCYTSWSDAAVVVEKNKLVNVADLDAMVREKLDGRIVKTVLCTKKQGFEYKIVVRKSGGRLQSVSVDARRPFAR